MLKIGNIIKEKRDIYRCIDVKSPSGLSNYYYFKSSKTNMEFSWDKNSVNGFIQNGYIKVINKNKLGKLLYG